MTANYTEQALRGIDAAIADHEKAIEGLRKARAAVLDIALPSAPAVQIINGRALPEPPQVRPGRCEAEADEEIDGITLRVTLRQQQFLALLDRVDVDYEHVTTDMAQRIWGSKPNFKAQLTDLRQRMKAAGVAAQIKAYPRQGYRLDAPD